MIEFIYYCLLYGVAITVILFTLCCFVLLKTSQPYPSLKRTKEEETYHDPISGSRIALPSLDEPWTVHLSVIIPAYDEEQRIKPMLDDCFEVLESRTLGVDFRYEVIVVSDGSRDKTVAKAEEYAKKYGPNKVRVLELVKNRGKGGAVRLGALSARGAVILFADADGATRFSDVAKLEESLKKLVDVDYLTQAQDVAEKHGIVCGSRAHMEDDAMASRSYFRTLLMHGFHFLVWLFAVKEIRDTQCGFKLLTRQAARDCFTSMHVERWAFDVELLYIAQQLNIPISEVAVHWTEIEGSKIVPVLSWLQMGKDLFLIWLRYTIGAWKIAASKRNYQE